MTPRERILAIGVGATVGLFGLQYVVSNLQQSLENKRSLIESANIDLEKATLTETAGFNAAKKLSVVRSKSLPYNLENLKNQYGSWLAKLGNSAGMSGISVNPSSTPVASASDAYVAYSFSLIGNCRWDQLIDLLAQYYDKDYLHSITLLKLSLVSNEPNLVNVNLTSQVLALKNASPTQPPSELSSGRLAMSAEEYKNIILNRNPFAPPNQPPKLATSRSQEIKLGEDWRVALEANDPEKNNVRFELVSTELPEGLQLRRGEMQWRPKALGEYKVTVRATDDGWPRRSIEEQLTLKVVEPPKEVPKVEPPKFDVASQAFVTMMVSGRGGPQASIRSRTEGKTFDLLEGSELEVGSIKAKVVSINLKEEFIELETDGLRWMLDWNSSVADAFKKSMVD